MTTNYNGRTDITTSYQKLRLGGAYLTNSLGQYITTALGQKIIVKVPGGDLAFVSYGIRDIVTVAYSGRIIP